MCGICGIWNKDSEVQLKTVLSAMTASLRHRGPDDEGYALFNEDGFITAGGADTLPDAWHSEFSWAPAKRIEEIETASSLAFGHRRLSVIDLSAAGHQPMSSEQDRYWIVFNGEIYNYIELRNELEAAGYSFQTKTDTEVLLQGYHYWEKIYCITSTGCGPL
jgi:asparagine synthase (glutamine-hydrolysing)